MLRCFVPAATTTYLTVEVKHNRDVQFDEYWNPGNYDYRISHKLCEELFLAAGNAPYWQDEWKAELRQRAFRVRDARNTQRPGLFHP